jgi:hypothetical protein
VSGLRQLIDANRQHADAILVLLQLTGNADNHDGRSMANGQSSMADGSSPHLSNVRNATVMILLDH